MSDSISRGQESIAVELPAEAPAWAGQLVDMVEDLQAENDRLRDRVEHLEDEQADHQERTARERAEDRKRITDVEDRVEDVDAGHEPQGSTGKESPADGHEQPQTPLEQTAGLPQEMVDRESANVRRAVFVARDVREYTTSVPAGRVITAGELARVLRAGTDCRGHSQTVDRVITILDDFGKDSTEIVERRGERRVVFTEDLCRRLERLAQPAVDRSHTVVAEGEA